MSRKKAAGAFAWSRTKADNLARSASHAASVGFEQTKRASSKLARSTSELTAVTAVHARAYGSQALASAKSLSEKAGEGAQQLRASLAEKAAASQPQTKVVSSELDEPSVTAQEPQRQSIVDFPHTMPRETPAEQRPASATIDSQPRVLAASALTKPPSRKVKADKMQAKEKTRRGGRGGNKKRKARRSK
ncbi:MAG TPA: hypothetical protein VIG52_13280 [Methyloceanibacter sp.]